MASARTVPAYYLVPMTRHDFVDAEFAPLHQWYNLKTKVPWDESKNFCLGDMRCIACHATAMMRQRPDPLNMEGLRDTRYCGSCGRLLPIVSFYRALVPCFKPEFIAQLKSIPRPADHTIRDLYKEAGKSRLPSAMDDVCETPARDRYYGVSLLTYQAARKEYDDFGLSIAQIAALDAKPYEVPFVSGMPAEPTQHDLGVSTKL